jgi:bacillithiol biosynthesis deacetylase BshB1
LPAKPSEQVGNVDLVAFSAHPDDVELFCAGTLLLAADSGLRTAIVDLTEGELSTNGDPVRRAAERVAASELLGLTARVSLGLPDGALGVDADEHREAVAETLRQLRPRVVLAPYWDDRHPDHAAAGRLTREACFLAGLEKFGAGSAHRPQRVYGYMLHHAFEPSVVIDVSAVWEQRRDLLEVYVSQVVSSAHTVPTPINDGRFAEMLHARATWFGAMVGVAKGEPFRVEGPLLLRSLPELDAAAVQAPSYQAYV